MKIKFLKFNYSYDGRLFSVSLVYFQPMNFNRKIYALIVGFKKTVFEIRFIPKIK